MEAFAVTAARVLQNWTALTFAVEHGTAGNPRESAQKKEDLLDDVLHICSSKPGDVCAIAELLTAAMEEDFNMTLEDGSEQDVARVLCELYRRIVVMGDLSACQAIPEAKHGNLFQFPEGAESSSESEDDSCDMEIDDVPRKMKPQPDSDGWTVVRK